MRRHGVQWCAPSRIWCADLTSVSTAYIAYAAVSANTGSDWYSQLLMSAFASHTQTSPLRWSTVQELLWGEDCSNTVQVPLMHGLTHRDA